MDTAGDNFRVRVFSILSLPIAPNVEPRPLRAYVRPLRADCAGSALMGVGNEPMPSHLAASYERQQLDHVGELAAFRGDGAEPALRGIASPGIPDQINPD